MDSSGGPTAGAPRGPVVLHISIGEAFRRTHLASPTGPQVPADGSSRDGHPSRRRPPAKGVLDMASPASRSGGPSRSPRCRWLRRAGIGGLSLVGLVLILVLGALAYLATPPGGERLRKLVVEKANAAIEERSQFKSSFFAVGT